MAAPTATDIVAEAFKRAGHTSSTAEQTRGESVFLPLVLRTLFAGKKRWKILEEEADIALSASSNTATLPADFGEWKSLRLLYSSSPTQYVDMHWVEKHEYEKLTYTPDVQSVPRWFTIYKEADYLLYVAPKSDKAYTLRLAYYIDTQTAGALTGTRLNRVYDKYWDVLVQGVYWHVLMTADDNRQMAERQVFMAMVGQAASSDTRQHSDVSKSLAGGLVGWPFK